MSIYYINWALKNSPETLTGSEQCILLCLANHASDNGDAWPSQDLLVAESHTSQATITRTLTKFERLGILTRTHIDKVLHYQFTLESKDLVVSNPHKNPAFFTKQPVKGIVHDSTTYNNQATTGNDYLNTHSEDTATHDEYSPSHSEYSINNIPSSLTALNADSNPHSEDTTTHHDDQTTHSEDSDAHSEYQPSTHHEYSDAHSDYSDAHSDYSDAHSDYSNAHSEHSHARSTGARVLTIKEPSKNHQVIHQSIPKQKNKNTLQGTRQTDSLENQDTKSRPYLNNLEDLNDRNNFDTIIENVKNALVSKILIPELNVEQVCSVVIPAIYKSKRPVRDLYNFAVGVCSKDSNKPQLTHTPTTQASTSSIDWLETEPVNA